MVPFSNKMLNGKLKLVHETIFYGRFDYNQFELVEKVFYSEYKLKVNTTVFLILFSYYLTEDEKLPIIIFSNSDLNSACRIVIEAVWGYCGLVNSLQKCFCLQIKFDFSYLTP